MGKEKTKNKGSIFFGEEQKRSMNFDLTLISSLSATLKSLGIRTLVEFGYGIEALTSHRLTRFHHDADLAIIFPQEVKEAEANGIITEILSEFTGRQWYSLPTNKRWLWLKAKAEDESDFSSQLNMHLYSSFQPFRNKKKVEVKGKDGNRFRINVAQGYLSDTDGEKYIFETPIPEEIAVAKVRLTSVYKALGENMRPQDLTDLNRLLSLNRFDFQLFEKILTEFYMSARNLDSEAARVLAQNEFNEIQIRLRQL